MDLNTVWFILVWVLLSGYAILDGFDLGVGTLHLFARNETERVIHMKTIAPVWDGNEVWLLTGGGALFAAFPVVYATVFSNLYLALVLVMLALIFRAVSLEFRNQVEHNGWKKFWDWSFGLGSLLPALLFGVAIGNLVRGLPIPANGQTVVPFVSLLNPYALLVGVFSVILLTMHGSALLAIKTEGELKERMVRLTARLWILVVVALPICFVYTMFAAKPFFAGCTGKPLFWLFIVLLLLATVYIPIGTRAGHHRKAFLASSLTIGSAMGLTATCMFPRIVPSTMNLADSLDIYNAASTPKTHTVMLVIALIGMPLVIAYTAFVYSKFTGTVTGQDGY